MIMNIKDGKSLPVYGDGKNIRDWIYVEDHNRAVWQIMKNGRSGQKYNIGGENEWENIRLLEKIIEITAEKLTAAGISGKSADEIRKTINYVKDRPGHDRRYAIDCTKIKTELGWQPSTNLDEGLKLTIDYFRKFI